MNIFILDSDPERAAQYHCDKHVVKMIVESAQMLSTAHRLAGANNSILYKQTHVNHPCSIWCRTNKANYHFLVRLALALCKEYTKRYKKVHKTQRIIEWCAAHTPKNLISEATNIKLTKFVQAMPDQYKDSYDPVQAYRQYYHGEKASFAKWKYTQVPDWWAFK